jgi:hypothetical protein
LTKGTENLHGNEARLPAVMDEFSRYRKVQPCNMKMGSMNDADLRSDADAEDQFRDKSSLSAPNKFKWALTILFKGIEGVQQSQFSGNPQVVF